MRCILTLALLTLAFAANAIEYPGGGKVVRVGSDPGTNKLTAGKHMFQLLLAEAVLHKENGWLFDDKAIIIKVDVKINGIDKKNVSQSTAKFTRVYEYEVSEYSEGNISIPFSNLLLLDWYPTQIDNRYLVTGVEIDVEIAKRVQETTFNHVINTVAGLTQNMNIPMNPYGETAKQLGLFTQQLLSDDFFKKTKSEKAKFTSIGIRFSPKDGLNNPVWVETDGAFAVLMGRKQDNNRGHVNVLNVGDVKFSYNQNGGLSLGSSGTSVSVANDHLVFVINSWETPEWAITSAGTTQPLQSFNIKAIDSVNSDKAVAQWHVNKEALKIYSNNLGMAKLSPKEMLEAGEAINKEKIITRSKDIGLDLKAIHPPSIDIIFK